MKHGAMARLCLCRYVPFYGTQLWSEGLGSEGACKPN